MSKQPALFEEAFTKDWQDHWQDMPEFVQPRKECFAEIVVRFRNKEDLDDFAKRIGQKLTVKTKATWHPPLEFGEKPARKYVYEP